MTESTPRYSAFVSYASADAEKAHQICESLESAGFRCWIAPRDVRAGHEYAEEILFGIENARTLILVLSEAANASNFVRREVERAVSKGKPVFPVRIEEVLPSRGLELFVSTAHWIDAWSGDFDGHLARLARDLADERTLDDAARQSRQAVRRLRAPRWIAFAAAALGLALTIIAAVIAANLLLPRTGGGGNVAEDRLAFSDLRQEHLRAELSLFTPFGGQNELRPRWNVLIVAAPEATNAFSQGGMKGFYSLDGEDYVESESPRYFSVSEPPSNRLLAKFVSFDGEEIGPFEFELDFRGFAITKLKEELKEQKSLVTCSPGTKKCSLNWTFERAMAAVERIEYATEATFADVRRIDVPEADFADYFDRDWLREQGLYPREFPAPEGAERLYYRVVYRDDEVGRTRTTEIPRRPGAPATDDANARRDGFGAAGFRGDGPKADSSPQRTDPFSQRPKVQSPPARGFAPPGYGTTP